jgi:translation initiation factor eIF-2B subunit delta
MDGEPFRKLTAYIGEAKIPLLISIVVIATLFFIMYPAGDHVKVSSTADNSPIKDAEKEDGEAHNNLTSTTPASSSKLSGAELKAQKKAEKAARRQQVVQTKQAGPAVAAPATTTISEARHESKQHGGKVLNKLPHERAELNVAEVETTPPRGNIEGPKLEDKTVELFRHLYKERATTIAGVSKDVHPAILALGQQMQSYTICGSNARLVATLQAVKRVRLSPVENPPPLISSVCAAVVLFILRLGRV